MWQNAPTAFIICKLVILSTLSLLSCSGLISDESAPSTEKVKRACESSMKMQRRKCLPTFFSPLRPNCVSRAVCTLTASPLIRPRLSLVTSRVYSQRIVKIVGLRVAVHKSSGSTFAQAQSPSAILGSLERSFIFSSLFSDFVWFLYCPACVDTATIFTFGKALYCLCFNCFNPCCLLLCTALPGLRNLELHT